VQGVVELSVAGSGEPVALDLAGEHLDELDAAVGGERGFGAEPADVAGVGQDLRRDEIACAVQRGQLGATSSRLNPSPWPRVTNRTISTASAGYARYPDGGHGLTSLLSPDRCFRRLLPALLHARLKLLVSTSHLRKRRTRAARWRPSFIGNERSWHALRLSSAVSQARRSCSPGMVLGPRLPLR
jgi:hypothetical protein